MTLQDRVERWCRECFGVETTYDINERNWRFLEESLELVQACGCSKEEVLQIVDYVYARPIGEKAQELGGAAVTLYALANAHMLGLNEAAEIELARCWMRIEKIREKQKQKPKFKKETQ